MAPSDRPLLCASPDYNFPSDRPLLCASPESSPDYNFPSGRSLRRHRPVSQLLINVDSVDTAAFTEDPAATGATSQTFTMT